MNEEQKALWHKVENFEIDDPASPFPFSHKLAKENGWSTQFAKRVVHEYKRFVFLGMAAGHAVSPSEAVDQAWHMHMVYTESYWKRFCGEILGRPFHHNPSKGGQDEAAKFTDWYQRTLTSYSYLFGEEPPSDIWPPNGDHHDFVRVDLRANWVVKKPKVKEFWKPSVLIVCGIVAFGCSQVNSTNPLDFRGPEFLAFYAALYACALVVAGLSRSALRKPNDGPASHQLGLNNYQIAYLNGGAVLALNLAVMALVRKGLASIDTKTGRIRTEGGYSNLDDPLQTAVAELTSAGTGRRMSELRQKLEGRLASVGYRLQEMGLLVNDMQAMTAVLVPFLIASLPIVVGMTKIGVGLSRSRPVALLVVFCVVSLVINLIAFCRKPKRSKYGDKVLNDLKSSQQDVLGYAKSPSQAPVDSLMATMAIFGMASLSGTEYSREAKSLQPPAGSSSCSGSTATGCGGDSGGGGCGGGGCGGCGGCGG